ncbi:MAG: hypothetical protein ABJN65_05865 [Parasphingorhabdus sp.]
MAGSPYLKSDGRLSDVISAIQTLGTYRFYRLSTEKWSERICGDETESSKWRSVFEQHPEFFRYSSDGKSVSLVLRRQKPKLFDVDSLNIITREERLSRDADSRKRISRSPLSESELQLLIGLATSFHSKAIADKKDGRWWLHLIMPIAVAAIGLGGVVVGSYLNGENVEKIEDLETKEKELQPPPTEAKNHSQ